jgi:vancomycin resistance protein YoaR
MAAAARRLGRLLRGLSALLWFSSLSLIIVLVLAYLAYNAQHYDRVYRGVSVLGIDVGGLSPAEALDTLQAQISPEHLPEIALQVGDDRTYIRLAELGGSVDLIQAVAEAFALGRGGTRLQDVAMRARLVWQGYDVAPPVALDVGVAELALRPVARAESDPARRARLLVSGLEAHVQPAAAGRSLNLEGTMAALQVAVGQPFGQSGWRATPHALALLRGSVSGGDVLVLEPLVAPISFDQLAPPLAEVAGASRDVAALIGAPLVLSWSPPDGAPERRWLIDQATLASWLALESDSGEAGSARVALDQEAIIAWVQSLQAQIDRPAINGRFSYDAAAAQLSVLEGEQLGYQLNVAETAHRIATQAFSPNRQVVLAVDVGSPAVSLAELTTLLPLELLGEGGTQFVGSTASRQANIVTASRLFEGVTLAAGETFSFLGVLGPVNRATGYEDSWVIFGNRTELGPGGGVCQVATTCFRAAFWSGLPMVERHPHAYRVSWYEPPVGLDASVFEPYVDLQFVNDYAHPLLVSVAVDEQAQTLTFRFYGRSGGREVTMEGPTSSNPRPAPEPVYEEDPTLAAGQRVQVENAHEGLDVTIIRRTVWPDGVQKEYDLTTRYAAWPARFLVGPGGASSD